MILLLALALQGIDPALPNYAPAAKVEGSLVSVGADTMNNLLTSWAEAFQKAHPGSTVSIEGSGTQSGVPALLSGTALLAPMVRAWKEQELEAFRKKRGFSPTEFHVASDALAVFVHKDNPIRSLTLEQVDAVFSKSRRRGGREVKTWGDLGLEGDWAARSIAIYGRNSASGTYGFFKETVLKNGDYKDEVLEQRGSAWVVNGCAADPFAIGYSGLWAGNPGVRAVPILAGDEAVELSVETALSGRYPLSRPLRIYIAREPGTPCDPRLKEFLRLVYSKQGQAIVVKDGYFPLTEKIAAEERKKLE